MNKATGVKSYFDNILDNGEFKNDYYPIKGEKIIRKSILIVPHIRFIYKALI